MIIHAIFTGMTGLVMEDERAALEKLGGVPAGYGLLQNLLANYAAPANKVAQLCRKGWLLRLKKGLFLVAPTISRQPVSGFLLSNHLYGPSYISLQSALEYYGMIPEAVHLYMAATPGRAKKYATPVGDFAYFTVPRTYYRIGIASATDHNGARFMLASPEKALCDLLLLTRGLRIRSAGAMWAYLTDFMRIDEESLAALDPDIIARCAAAGRKQEMLEFLLKAIKDAR